MRLRSVANAPIRFRSGMLSTALQHLKRSYGCAAQRAEEGQRAPVAVRGEAAQAFALRSPAAQRRHVGFDPEAAPDLIRGLIDEDQPPRVQPGLPGSPALRPARDIGAGLLKGEQLF